MENNVYIPIKHELIEEAVKTHKRRRERFEAEGLSADEAFDLAEQMFDRDMDPDGRRVCFECKNLKGKFCTYYKHTNSNIRFMLQRCPGFDLRGAK